MATVREHGTLGLDALWKQLRDTPPPFPPATHGDVMRPLGALRGNGAAAATASEPAG